MKFPRASSDLRPQASGSTPFLVSSSNRAGNFNKARKSFIWNELKCTTSSFGRPLRAFAVYPREILGPGSLKLEAVPVWRWCGVSVAGDNKGYEVIARG